jgi:hypothetical protein
MGTFATVIVTSRSLLADKGKQTSVLCFRLQQTNGNCRFSSVPFSCVCNFIYIFIYMLLFQKENGKWKPRRFPLFRLPFAHRAKGHWPFVRLVTKKQTEVICLQTKA